ncbi:hypothetical protein BB560_003394 [Smittium megazygosporum]|uniref:Uncharacterized protein n=1 Tax=Smittium megazygosporum TaxID=133381 RepID=A0A2T9ZC46_9FUNG|nr:hypothetical protein BB560_003394 [Smittium megazygosporum]
MLLRSQVDGSSQITRLKKSMNEYKIQEMLSLNQRLNFNIQISLLLCKRFKDIERNRRITSIDEIDFALREKAESYSVVSGRSSTVGVYRFDIYQKSFIREG